MQGDVSRVRVGRVSRETVLLRRRQRFWAGTAGERRRRLRRVGAGLVYCWSVGVKSTEPAWVVGGRLGRLAFLECRWPLECASADPRETVLLRRRQRFWAGTAGQRRTVPLGVPIRSVGPSRVGLLGLSADAAGVGRVHVGGSTETARL